MPGMGLLGAVPSQLPGHQNAQPNINSVPLLATSQMVTNSPALLPSVMAPPPQPVASEWPQQRSRTGPPPGTKITENTPVSASE